VGSPVFCPVCGLATQRLAPGPNGRPLAACPWCGCLERHRLLTVLARGMGGSLVGGRVLEIAPSPFTTSLLRDLGPSQLISADFDPAADGRAVDVQASLTALPFPDATFDFVLCLHVLEHIPDDRAAMAELARVLAPTGVCLLQVPWSVGRPTDEDSEPVDAAERVRRFGRVDHVRQYGGATLDERLGEAGLDVYRFATADVFGPDVIRSLGLMGGEVNWVVRPVAGRDLAELDEAGRGSAELEKAGRSLPEVVAGWLTPVVGPDGNRLPDLLPPLIAASERAVAGERAAVDAERVTAEAHDAALDAQNSADRAAADAAHQSARAAELADRLDELRARLTEQSAAARRAAAATAEDLAAVRAVERAARRDAALWERRYTVLRNRLPIRVAARVGVPLRAAVQAARAAAAGQSSRGRD